MMKIVKHICFLFSVAAILSSCGEYNRLVKSKDTNLKFQKGIEYFQKGKFNRTITLLSDVAPLLVGTEREDSVMYYLGSAYFSDGDLYTSSEVFDDFRRRFGRSPFIEAAEYKYATGFYYMSPDPNRDQSETVKAIAAISEYLARYPQSIQRPLCEARIAELQHKLYEKSYINARTYYKTARYKSAVIALRNAIAEYPKTPYREELLYLTTRSCYELATNSIPSLQRDRYMDMMDSYYTFIAEFPDSKHRSEMDRMQRRAKEFLGIE